MKACLKIKLILLLFITVVQLSLFAEPPSNDKLQGEWKFSKLNYILHNNNKLSASKRNSEVLLRKNNIGKTLKFTDNKLYQYKNGVLEDSSLYKTVADTLLFVGEKYDFFYQSVSHMNFKIKGNILTIDMNSSKSPKEKIRVIYKRK